MSNDLKLGEIIVGHQYRDAIHIAVAPVVAGDALDAGMPIGFGADSETAFFAGKLGAKYKAIGIVDPFLRRPVNKGDKFWMFLYPNTVIGMRHEWQHPAFKDGDIQTAKDPEGESRRVLENIAAELDVTYTALMRDAERGIIEPPLDKS